MRRLPLPSSVLRHRDWTRACGGWWSTYCNIYGSPQPSLAQSSPVQPNPAEPTAAAAGFRDPRLHGRMDGRTDGRTRSRTLPVADVRTGSPRMSLRGHGHGCVCGGGGGEGSIQYTYIICGCTRITGRLNGGGRAGLDWTGRTCWLKRCSCVRRWKGKGAGLKC